MNTANFFNAFNDTLVNHPGSNGGIQSLSPQEVTVANALSIDGGGNVVLHAELIEALYPGRSKADLDPRSASRVLRLVILKLRRKMLLSKSPYTIITKYGQGYVLAPTSEQIELPFSDAG
jgi:DNA-binding response OmpR family regulator